MIARIKHIDWIAIGLIGTIPFRLIWLCVMAALVAVKDYLVPTPIREWFGARLQTPYVRFKFGFIPIYKPFNKWDRAN